MARRTLLGLVAALLLAATYRLDAQVTYDRILRAAGEPQNWLTYGGTYMSQRYSALRQIDVSNAKNLEAKWIPRWSESGVYRFDRSRSRADVFSIGNQILIAIVATGEAGFHFQKGGKSIKGGHLVVISRAAV